MVQSVRTRTVLEYKPNKAFRNNHLVKSCDVGVDELAMMVYFSGEVRIVFVGGLQDHLLRTSISN